MANDLQNDWIEHFLGVRPPAARRSVPPTALLARYRAAKIAWQAATETVDAQINGLAKVLQGSGDADLQQIANTGLMTVTGGFRTRMMAALIDIGDGDIGKLRKGAAKTAGFAQKLREQIDGDARVIACDENEFGATVAIRATLGPALAELAHALDEAATA